MTAVKYFIGDVRAQMSKGFGLADATRLVRCQKPQLIAEVLDQIGSWPSSEVELRELQRQA